MSMPQWWPGGIGEDKVERIRWGGSGSGRDDGWVPRVSTWRVILARLFDLFFASYFILHTSQIRILASDF
jgi:hypothetical protein